MYALYYSRRSNESCNHIRAEILPWPKLGPDVAVKLGIISAAPSKRGSAQAHAIFGVSYEASARFDEYRTGTVEIIHHNCYILHEIN